MTIAREGKTKFEFSIDQLAPLPFYVILRSQRINSSLVEERSWMPGFKINWFIADNNGSKLTEQLPSRTEDWKQEEQTPQYEQPLLAEMAQLARQLRMQNMTREQILDKVIRDKMKNINVLEEKGICWSDPWSLGSMTQIKSESLTNVLSKLMPLEHHLFPKISPGSVPTSATVHDLST